MMFFFCYALVPLYQVLCKNLGLNGKTNPIPSELNQGAIDQQRTVTVQFLATNNANLPWDFYPNTKTVNIHPGESIKVTYHARNNTDHTMTVQAVPSVAPGLAASHLKKTECFCFKQQTLAAHQATDMVVIFHLDTELPKNIVELTLSYTLFEAKKPIKNRVQGKLN